MKVQILTPLALHELGGRSHLEDYIYPEIENLSKSDRLFIIADGVGRGKKGGETAELIAQNFAEFFEIIPPEGKVDDAYVDKALEWVEEALTTYVQGNPSSKGVTATVVFVHFGESCVTLAWVGDSRAYYYNRKKDRLISTEDHSVINDLLKRGKIKPNEVTSHPDRHRLLRAIQGSDHPTRMDAKFIPTKDIGAGDYFFLCSDGLLETIGDSDLKTFFSASKTPEDILTEIRHFCKGNTRDNYSCILIPVSGINSSLHGLEKKREITSQAEGIPAAIPVSSKAEASSALSAITESVPETAGWLSKDWAVYSLISLIGLTLLFLVWLAVHTPDSDHKDILARANQNAKKENHAMAVAQYDSVLSLTKNATEKARVLSLKQKSARADHHRQILNLEEIGTYPAYMQALDLAQYAIEQYGDDDQSSLYKAAKSVEQKIATFAPGEAFPQLLAEAEKLCRDGKNEKAEQFFAEADKFDELLGTQQALASAQSSCMNSFTSNRSIEPSQSPANRSPSSRSEPSPASSTLSKISDVSKQERGQASARTKVSESPFPQTVKSEDAEARKLMERGKRLYEKAKQSQSAYEYMKAAEYLENAGRALDAEGYHMLARLYERGLGVKQDLKKALEFARQAALQGSGDGHYQYAHLLLLRLNPGDTLTAKKSLRIAVEKGSKEAELRLRLLQP